MLAQMRPSPTAAGAPLDAAVSQLQLQHHQRIALCCCHVIAHTHTRAPKSLSDREMIPPTVQSPLQKQEIGFECGKLQCSHTGRRSELLLCFHLTLLLPAAAGAVAGTRTTAVAADNRKCCQLVLVLGVRLCSRALELLGQRPWPPCRRAAQARVSAAVWACSSRLQGLHDGLLQLQQWQSKT